LFLFLLSHFSILVEGLYLRDRRWRDWRSVRAAFAGGAVFVVGAARFCVNLVQYGAPFQRTVNQHVELSFGNLLANLHGIALFMADFIHRGLFDARPVGILGLGLGTAGIVTCIALPFLQSPHSSPRQLEYVGLIFSCIIGFLFTASANPWWPWSFRYFIPWISIAVLFVLAFVLRNLPSKFMTRVGLMAVILAGLHFFVTARERETMPGENLADAFVTAQKRSQLQRKLAFHQFMVGEVERAGLFGRECC
jgi:hypothetical protein